MAATDSATPRPGAVATPGRAGFADLWLAETVRLREEHWGPLEDQDAVRQARQADGPIEHRVLLRARAIARREHLDERVAAWRRGAGIAAVLLLALAVLAGVGTAWSALGDGTRVVNIVWAAVAMLGLHALTFLFWLSSFAVRAGAAGAGLGGAWLWLTRKLARGPDAALPPQALMALLARAGAARWLFGAISHLLWLAALAAALATSLAVLSTARYRFAWATTLLSPDAFVGLTQALGWLPARLGFALPDAAIVRLSDGMHDLPAAAQAQWAWWLVGLVVVYGILPRLLAWLVSVARLRGALRGLSIDMALPGYAALRSRLLPPADPPGQDGPAPWIHAPRIAPTILPPTGGQAVLAGLELPDDIVWPPPDLPTTIRAAGNLDSREQRHALLDALAQAPARRLLLACDTRQTPDRGTLALIADLAGKAAETRVWLLAATAAGPNGDRSADETENKTGKQGCDNTRELKAGDAQAWTDRTSAWRSRLLEAGMPAEAIVDNRDQPLRWLEGDHG
ncbi:DUF2868 domain-containing protein [Bordetella genomosp. 11]|uniref:DUF2868 domain-containing protein n=1 Tax=Bordetella genomosp. 11 TaxID=1416808 RepID=A0A261UZF9_9BORD|nr:DUF2868 domain-containing protein [Bordetella genomosp. 11]OZI66293.1 hypothetical protein CAL28_00650 [Bordetella genomosp. 11]